MIKYYQDNNQNLRKEYDSMKKLSAVLFAALCIILVISLCICIYGVWDIICAAGDLANDPSASGIDYMGLGWGTAIALMVSSALGLILSCISRKMQRDKRLRSVSLTSIVIFALLIVVSVLLFYR